MANGSVKAGSLVWARSAKYPEESWCSGMVQAVMEGKRKVVLVKLEMGGEMVECDADQVVFRNPSLAKSSQEDLCELPDLHRPALLEALHDRFRNNRVYSFSGTILLAVNPFKQIPGLYSSKEMQQYLSAVKGAQLAPHPWSIAKRAFSNMVDEKRNQVVLISGESGAGKTVSTKIVLDYLTAASSSSKKNKAEIGNRVVEANPLMESFGNAKTVRNDNSSRFGKLIQLHFDDQNALESASVQTFLLEKSRVVHQRRGERNFHVFYEIESAPKELRENILWPGIENANYTSMSGCYARDDGVTDKAQLANTMKALGAIGFSSEERNACFYMVSAVLNLGNVDFEESNDAAQLKPSGQRSVEACARLLGIDASELCNSLTSRVISVGLAGKVMKAVRASMSRSPEVYRKPNTVQEAREARDGLAQTLYERMFTWLIERINAGLNFNVHAAPQCIGILDIFGFEVLQTNGLEQLLINYTNERLQNQFNEHVFAEEQREYSAEGIDWTVIEFPDNSPCVELVERGIVSLINEECLLPQGNDSGLATKLFKLDGSEFFYTTSSQKGKQQFTIRHFAGDVTYGVAGFCRTNKQQLRQETKNLLFSSTNPIFKRLLGGLARESVIQTGRLQSETVGSSFRSQLRGLMSHMSLSAPHYIRCIKSNDRNVPDVFHRQRVEDQLAYSGVLEAIKVKRAGFSSRWPLAAFCERYASLLDYKVTRADARTKAEVILTRARLKAPVDCQIGRTKVFLKPQAYTTLEIWRLEQHAAAAVVIQRAFRAFLRRYGEVVKRRREKEEERKRLEREAEQQRAQRLQEEERRRRERQREEEARQAEERLRQQEFELEMKQKEEQMERELEMRRRQSEARRAEKLMYERAAEKERTRKMQDHIKMLEEQVEKERSNQAATKQLRERIEALEAQTERIRKEAEEREALELRLLQAERDLEATVEESKFAAERRQAERERLVAQQHEQKRKQQAKNQQQQLLEEQRKAESRIRELESKTVIEKQKAKTQMLQTYLEKAEEARQKELDRLLSEDRAWRDKLNEKGAQLSKTWGKKYLRISGFEM